MRRPRIQTLVLLGVLLGFTAMVVVGATIDFSPGEAGKISDGVTYESPSGMEVKYWGETNVSMENMYPDSDTVEIISESGNITMQAGGSAHAEVHTTNITGTWTNATSMTAGGTWVEIYPEDKQRVDTRGDVTALSVRSMAVDDGQTDFWFSGTDGGTVSVRIYGLPANTELGAFDASTDSLLDGATTDSNGVATFDMPASSHAVELQTTDNSGPTLSNPDPEDESSVVSQDQTLSIDVEDPQFSVGDTVDVTLSVNGTFVDSQTISSAQTVSTNVGGLSEGEHTWTVEAEDSYGVTTTKTYTFTVDHHDPVISNQSPTGLLDSNPSDISADISDGDFSGDGDSLDVTIDLGGSQIHSETITANQSVSTAIPNSGLTGGQHEYTIAVTDQYGQTVETTGTYSVPDTFYVRNELNHSDLIDSGINLNITFFGPDTVYSRTSSDGTLQMTDLPVSSDFIAVAVPSDENYTTRALYLQSIYEQQSVYLLNTSAVTTVESRFVLEDPTGQYGSQSVLAIQRALDINGTTQWQTVHSDQFGTEGVTVTLEQGVRYRTKIMAQDGTQQIVGPYRASVSETVTVQPGAPTVDIPTFEEGYGYNAQIQNRTVEYRYDDPENETDEVTVWIHEKGNESNRLVANSSFYNVGSVYNSFTVSENESEKTWVVNFVIERNGEQIVQSRTISNQKRLFSQLAPGLQAAIGVVLLLLLGGAFSVLNAGVGAVVVSISGGLLWWVGLLSGVASAILIAIAIFVAVAYHLAKSSGP